LKTDFFSPSQEVRKRTVKRSRIILCTD